MKLFTSDGAREFELDTPNLLWFVLTLSTISVPNLTTFLQVVLRADFWAEEEEEKRRKKEEGEGEGEGEEEEEEEEEI